MKQNGDVRIIFVNGAPRSGKDTFATDACWYHDAIRCSFKEPLVEAVKGLFGIDHSEWDTRYDSPLKEVEWVKLKGMSQREALIWMSETVSKPAFGQDFFGLSLINIIDQYIEDGDELIVIPDSGFLPETKAVVDAFGTDCCIMVNTFKEGTNFDNDSRSLITGDMLGIKGYDLHNKGSLEDYNKACKELLEKILE